MSENPKFTNRLAKAKSPYLLQHKHNPVDWYEWGEEAFEKARLENKPIFLSVGYSTCHWCHVMAHESFEDEETAKMMNDAFVNIKVDREERPDIDHIYMTVCQIMNGSGGWPLSVIMTPQRKPFFAGTYFPRVTTGTRFGMQEISKRTVELWQDKRAEILESAEEFANELNKNITETAGHGLQSSIMRKAYHELAANYDEIQGGFGDHPKFPVPHNLSLLMRYHKHAGSEDAAKMVENTLQKMRMGGIWDHIGYGFHRYSTDSEWLLPHFEKMLYDQALMLIAYSEAYQLFGKAEYKETAEEIIAYVTHDLRSEEGGFYSAEDADSEGEEGKFYLWEINEVRKALIGDADFYCEAFNIESDGNYRDERSKEYTGKNIPHRRMSYKELADANNQSVEQIKERIDDLRGKLFEAREKRVRPGLDDKILTDWNGLMVAALSVASRALDNSDYLELAQETYNFINANMFTEDGKLLHRYREGESGIHAMIDDYAYLIWAAIELYESTLNYVYLDDAIVLTDKMIEEFWDAEQLGFYFTGKSGELLIARRKELYDGAMPSGNSINLMNLARLYKITGNKKYGEYANKTQLAFAGQVSKVPSAFSQFIMGYDFLTPSSKEVVIVGDDGDETRELILELKSMFLPSTSFIYKNVNVNKIRTYAEFTKDMKMIDGKPTVYICTDFACGQPSNDIEQIKKELSK